MTEKTETPKINRGIFFGMMFRSLRDLCIPMRRPVSEKIEIKKDELRVWMIGHATALINIYGTTILTDPILVHSLPFPRRVIAAGYTAEELPHLDLVVVSHAHLDHFNKPSLRAIVEKTDTIIVPRKCSDVIAGMNFKKVVELDWEQTFATPEITVTAYRTEHWGKRYPWETVDRGFNCYVFEKNGHAVFFGGDTGYGSYFREIGRRHALDVALLPISAYNPEWFRVHHMNPADALRAAKDLNTKHVIPIHWGNFRLSLESLLEPPELFLKLAKEQGIKDSAHLLLNGESFLL
jgi:L-ascorbate metabolism protein UlaG (beta-lactamase superfamily)